MNKITPKTSEIVKNMTYKSTTAKDWKEQYPVNRQVVLYDLQSRPELNDKDATVIEPQIVIDNRNQFRVCVQTQDGEKLRIKPANLLYDTGNNLTGQSSSGYDIADGAPIHNCLNQLVGMHNSYTHPITKRNYDVATALPMILAQLGIE